MSSRPFIAITMGDPAGIGAEVTAKALQDQEVYEKCKPFVVGSAASMDEAIRLIDAPMSTRFAASLDEVAGEPGTVDVLDLENLVGSAISYGEVSPTAGKASVEWIIKAAELAGSDQVKAIVTAPINKEACSLAGYKDIGHMEILQRRTGSLEVATMLMAGTLRVVHLTTHRSLRVACDYVTRANVLAKLTLTHEHFTRWGFERPRIAVAALNPHASDGGLLGDEEVDVEHLRTVLPYASAHRVQWRNEGDAEDAGQRTDVLPIHRAREAVRQVSRRYNEQSDRIKSALAVAYRILEGEKADP
ncbi:MAG: 4-hydroxythreonine-4-phosphate dehydrogenase PdxA, partial [SAR202 cluster bacterium]|nr:4-hydroxythreonine-4-phosphate dehydrogenase PdxA [SAR202 cluster bacterium]